MSDLPFSRRFRNLVEHYKTVLERWRIFWERINAEARDPLHQGSVMAWDGFKQAFLTAASTLAELRGDVPPEVANLWIGPTGLVPIYYGSLRVGEALDKQAEWFQEWMREVMGKRDVAWIWERSFYAERARLQQAIEDLMTAVEVIQEWEGEQQAEAIISKLENPSVTPKGTTQAAETTAKTATQSTDTMTRMIKFFAKVAPENLEQILKVIEGPMSVNDKLLALEQMGVIGGEDSQTFSAKSLADLLNVNPSTIKRTPYWRRLRKAKAGRENQDAEESVRKYSDRAELTEGYPFD